MMPIYLPTITAGLALLAAFRIAIAWPWPVTRWLWSATCLCAAIVFSRPLLVAAGGVDPAPARDLLIPLAALSVLSLADIAWRRRQAWRLVWAAGALISALIAWPLSTIEPWVAAALCYPPLWALFAAVIWGNYGHHSGKRCSPDGGSRGRHRYLC